MKMKRKKEEEKVEGDCGSRRYVVKMKTMKFCYSYEIELIFSRDWIEADGVGNKRKRRSR